MQSHENCLSLKVRSKGVRNDEKLDLSGIENKLWAHSLGKNLSHQPSTAPQGLQYGKLCEFPHSD